MASIIFGTTLDMLTVATPSSGAYIVAIHMLILVSLIKSWEHVRIARKEL